MTWYRTSAGANGVNSYANDLGTVLAVSGTSPSFTVSIGATVLAGTFTTAALAEVVLLKIMAASREDVIDPSVL